MFVTVAAAAAVVWLAVAAPLAVLIGRSIRLADRREVQR